MSGPPQEPPATDAVHLEDLRDELGSKLPGRVARVWKLRVVDGLQYSEIQRLTGVSAREARTLLENHKDIIARVFNQ